MRDWKARGSQKPLCCKRTQVRFSQRLKGREGTQLHRLVYRQQQTAQSLRKHYMSSWAMGKGCGQGAVGTCEPQGCTRVWAMGVGAGGKTLAWAPREQGTQQVIEGYSSFP